METSAPLDELYLRWLYEHIGSSQTKNPSRTYWQFACQLYKKEFVWIVPNDDNRWADGRDLRLIFFEECKIEDPDPEWSRLGCSMLEMLVALSQRLYFMTGDSARDWFWDLIENIGLTMRGTSDRVYTKDLETTIDDILDRIIWRTYSKTGDGGLFPVPDTQTDQRKLEIWYQMSEYLADDF